ncbi:MAG: hypothetical protein OXF73_11740 [Gammaproteobacteria bacterium]|nr:hypothetical protein [Gammaproteobacteria bacterium]MCY4227198.1 hypothetical protein [Gammaproteobacteria bacterium]
MHILFLQPAGHVADLGIDLQCFGNLPRYGVVSLSSLPRKLRDVGLVVNCIDTNTAARRILEAAASCKVPRLYLFDGIYDLQNAYHNPLHRRLCLSQMDPMLYTHVACVDRWSLTAFAALDVHTHAWLPSRAEPIGDKKSDQNLRAEFLIATARTPAFDYAEQDRLEKLLLMVIASLKRIGTRYRFRIGDRKLLASLGASADDNDIDTPFSECIRHYRCLITTPSTIATTSMLAGVPTATLDYRDSPLTQQTGWRIHQLIDMDSVLTNMLKPAADRMVFQAREVAHLAKRTPVEDFILDAAGIAERPPFLVSTQRIQWPVNMDYPLRWIWMHWLKRFRKQSR